MVAYWVHIPEVVGSIPISATKLWLITDILKAKEWVIIQLETCEKEWTMSLTGTKTDIVVAVNQMKD